MNWPTATAGDAKQSGAAGYEKVSASTGRARNEGTTLTDAAARLWSTPRASPNENRNTKPAPSHGLTHGRTLAGDSVETGERLNWPTPVTMNRKSRKALTSSEENGRRSGGGNSSPPGLEQAAEIFAGEIPPEMDGIRLPPATEEFIRRCSPPKQWATPKASDSERGEQSPYIRGGNDPLPRQATNWATPMTRDYRDGACAESSVPTDNYLGRQAARWPTPRATEGEHGGPQGRDGSGSASLTNVASNWPTPTTANPNEEDPARWRERQAALKEKGSGNGNGAGVPLAIAAQEASAKLWPTPTAKASEDSQTHRSGGRSDELLLTGLAKDVSSDLSMDQWPTPNAGGVTGYMSGSNRDVWRPTLEGAAQGLRPSRGRPDPTTSTPGGRSSASGRILNPRFVEWLMGIHPIGSTEPESWGIEWTGSAPSETPSTLTRPSEPSSISADDSTPQASPELRRVREEVPVFEDAKGWDDAVDIRDVPAVATLQEQADADQAAHFDLLAAEDSVPAMAPSRFLRGWPSAPFAGATQIKTFLRAPRLWFAFYVVGLPEKKQKALAFGTALHAALERWALGQEMFPANWHKADPLAEIDLMEADVVRRLVLAAIEKKIVQKGEGLLCGFDRDVEATFRIPFLPAEPYVDGAGTISADVAMPAVELRGSIDVPLLIGIDDHKTTKSIGKYAKEGWDLKHDPQLNLYAFALMTTLRKKGLPVPERFRLRHLYYQKSPLEVDTREAYQTPAEVEKVVATLVPVVRQMRDLAIRHARYLEDNDGSTAQLDAAVWGRWFDVPCVVSTPPRAGQEGVDDRAKILQPAKGVACGDYSGCPVAGVCAGVEDGGVAGYRLKATAAPSGGTGNIYPKNYGTTQEERSMSILDRMAALAGVNTQAQASPSPTNGAGYTTAAPSGGGAATLNPPLPSAEPVKAPPAQPLAVTPAAPPVPQGAKLRERAPGAPSWARPHCGACVTADDKVSGLSRRGNGACNMCNSWARNEKKVNGDMFEWSYSDGVYQWCVKAEFSHLVPPDQQEGSFRMSAAPAPVVTPAAAPTPPLAIVQTAANPAPVVNAGNSAPVMGQNVATPARDATPTLVNTPTTSSPLAPLPTPAPMPLSDTPSKAGMEANQSAIPTGGPASAPGTPGAPVKYKFTLCLNCGPEGEKAIRLETVFRRYADELAQSYSKRHQAEILFEDIKSFERWDYMAAMVPRVIETEKFGSGWVVCYPERGSDLERFATAMAMRAATVIRARG